MEGKTNLISLYGEMIHLEDKRKAVNVVCLNFRKGFETFSIAFPCRKQLLKAGMSGLFSG